MCIAADSCYYMSPWLQLLYVLFLTVVTRVIGDSCFMYCCRQLLHVSLVIVVICVIADSCCMCHW